MTDFIIMSYYPLTEKKQETILSTIGKDCHFLVLTKFATGKNIVSLFKNLFDIRCKQLYIVFEDQNISFTSTILQIFAATTRAKKFFFIDHANNTTKFSRFNILITGLQLFKSTILNFFAYVKANFDFLFLNNSKLPVFSKQPKSCFYLNGNLWFGVKAGGSVGHIAGIANSFTQQNMQVNYISYCSNVLLDSNVVQDIIHSNSSFGVPRTLNYCRMGQLLYKTIVRKHTSNQFNFIYERLSVANYTGVMLSKHWGIPLILEYNGSNIWISDHWGMKLKFRTFAKKIELLCLQQATLIVTVSDVLKKELESFGIPENKIVCYPNCIDPSIFNPKRFNEEEKISLRKKYSFTENTKVITFVGTFGIWHGVEVLARTIVKFGQTHRQWLQNNNVRFMLVGDGPLMDTVKNIIHEGEMHEFATITGLIEQSQTPSYLAISDIFVSPHIQNQDGSAFFGSPTKLFEYMAMEKPIIASDLEQIGEVLYNSLRSTDFQTIESPSTANLLSVLVKPGDIDDLMRAIVFLVEQPEISQTLGINARKEVLTKYTWDIHVSKIMEAYTHQAKEITS